MEVNELTQRVHEREEKGSGGKGRERKRREGKGKERKTKESKGKERKKKKRENLNFQVFSPSCRLGL